MSTIGQKIKEVFTGHDNQDKSDAKTPDVNAPGAFPSDDSSTNNHKEHNKLTKEPPGHAHPNKSDDVERGAQHHTGHTHHDPEPETKQATSEAGNYPYWGNLPREGGEHVHRSEGPESGATRQQDGLSKDSGLATGALATGSSAAGTGYLGSDHSKHQDTSRADEITRADTTKDSDHDHFNRGSAAAAAAGVAGTTYLVTRDKGDSDKSEKKSTHDTYSNPAHSNTSKTTQHENHSTIGTTQKPAEAATPTKTTSAGDNNSHRKEEEALAAGAGAAGLAGAGYYASQRGDEIHDARRDTGTHGTQGGSTQVSSHTATSHHDPGTEAQKATSAAGNYPHWNNDDNGNRSTKNTGVAEAATPTKTTSSGDNDSHRKEQAIAAGTGASGLAGVGYLANKKLDSREERTHASASHQDPDYEARRATSGAGNHPHLDNDKNGHDNKQGLAAAGVAGAGLAGAGYLASNRTNETSSGTAGPASSAERDTTGRQVDSTTSGGIHNTVAGAGSHEHSHPVGSSHTTGASHREDQAQSPGQHGRSAAQSAAQQAWNRQHPASPSTAEDTTKDSSRHPDLKYAAAGAAFGAGAATGLAADYGQGRDHETNPRTDKSEKIAERALGSDGRPHAPSSSSPEGPAGLASGGSGLAGQTGGSSKIGSKVLHKCDNCGHDNDISRYFDKDAVFRSQQ